MTPAEFSAALDVLGWSRRHLVGQLGCNTTLANQVRPRLSHHESRGGWSAG